MTRAIALSLRMIPRAYHGSLFKGPIRITCRLLSTRSSFHGPSSIVIGLQTQRTLWKTQYPRRACRGCEAKTPSEEIVIPVCGITLSPAVTTVSRISVFFPATRFLGSLSLADRYCKDHGCSLTEALSDISGLREWEDCFGYTVQRSARRCGESYRFDYV